MGRIIVALQMSLLLYSCRCGTVDSYSPQSREYLPWMKVDGLVIFGDDLEIKSLQQGRAFYRELIGKLRDLPGVSP